MINHVVLVGRITKDPILRKTQNNTSMVPFTIACDGYQGQETDFISCIAWSSIADFMAKYIKKGALLGIEGRIQSRSYDDKNGKHIFNKDVIASKVIALESQKDRQLREQSNLSNLASLVTDEDLSNIGDVDSTYEHVSD